LTQPHLPPRSSEWTPSSWREKPALQQPDYPDAAKVEAVVAEMSRLPPLVTSWEVESLKSQLAACARGEMFLLQGGDCAESFDTCEADSIVATLKILLQMSLVLVYGSRRKVLRVGRIAGQYAKPRSAALEQRGTVSLPAYRGDLINRRAFTAESRTPDPELMLRGFERAALTLNFMRALAQGGFADLHHPEYWELEFVNHASMRAEYLKIVDTIRDSVDFMENVLDARLDSARRAEFFTSHEALLLLYEEAQTRTVPRRDGHYNLSTHFPWIGVRTADPGGAHVEYFRGIRNPVAVKIGPAMPPEQVVELTDILHPDDEPGRMTLIHRFGAAQIASRLPPLIEAVRKTGKSVTWSVDPMHGNTEVTASGRKTRRFDTILGELREAIRIHRAMGTELGGVHFELTGHNVTECVGGARGPSDDDLDRAYLSVVDPRLNYEQSLEMAMIIAHEMRQPSS
jgi:3-deoxy-7-phosphoheptulonate synthase